MFAVRQWPGNGADLDFRGVLEGCTAAIVAAAPIEGTLLKEPGKESIANTYLRDAFLKSDEYAAIAEVLPFCRLWCVRQPYPSSNLARSSFHSPSANHPTNYAIQ